MNCRLNQQLAFLFEVDKMKNIMRQTVLVDRSRQENSAEHSWHFALMAVTFFEYNQLEGVDLNRVIKMALVHDVVEIYAGDTFAYDIEANKEKEQREQLAADKLFSLLPNDQAKEFRSLWEEFDEMKTPDAIYATAIDRLQPFLNNSVTSGHSWAKHNVTLPQVYDRMDPVRIATPVLWAHVEEVIFKSLDKGYIAY